MTDSRDRKRQVTLFESFNSIKKARNSETSTRTSVEASVGGDSGGSSFTHSDGHDTDSSNVSAAELSDCDSENDDLVTK